MFKQPFQKHSVFIALIFLLTIIYMHNIVSTSKIMDNIHYINDITFVSHNLKDAIFKYGNLHLWTPDYYSGRPLYAQPEYYFLDANFIYLLLFRNVFIAMNLAAITYFFLTGLGMYFLFLVFSDSKKGAFIASIIYMFNGYHFFVVSGNLNVLAGYSLIPFGFMFFVKALKTKKFAKNAIFSGLFIALQIFAGGTLFIPYEILIFGIYSLFHIAGKNFSKRVIKLAIIGLIVFLVGFGISGVKLIPGIEFLNLSNRGSGISYQEYLGEPINPSSFIYVFVTNLFSGEGMTAAIGLMGFILLLSSLHRYKKKHVVFSLSLIVLAILMAIKSPVSDLFFKIPVYNQLRHIDRAIYLSAFASSILAGTGFVIFSEKIKKIIKFNKEITVFIAVSLLILTELLFLQNFPQATEIKMPNDIEINDFISKDSSRFRTINLALSTLVGGSGYNYLTQLGIGTIKGGSGIWFNDYLVYLSVAQQSNPAKLWGMLNNKYVISDRELDYPGLKFISTFEECKGCQVGEADGPYLYENLEFMPRAFIVDKGILVLGSKQDVEQIVYPLIINENFNPRKSVIVHGKSLSGYSLQELVGFDAIILTESVRNEDLGILKAYIDTNRTLLPNIFDNQNTISNQDIENLFSKLEGNYGEIEILEYENNKVVYNLRDKKGFLVLSERFSNFPGWEASGNKNIEILRANGIITAFFVENDDKITLKYWPKSFRNGLIISLVTLLLLIAYFTYTYIAGGSNKD
jgi:hypothetical protein